MSKTLITPEKFATAQRDRVLKDYAKIKKHRSGLSFFEQDLRDIFWPQYLKEGHEFFNVTFPQCKHFEPRESTQEHIRKKRTPFYCRKKKKVLYEDERGRSECRIKRGGWKTTDNGQDLVCGYEPVGDSRKPFSLETKNLKLRNMKRSRALHEALGGLSWRYLSLARKAYEIISGKRRGITARALYHSLHIPKIDFMKYVEPRLLSMGLVEVKTEKRSIIYCGHH